MNIVLFCLITMTLVVIVAANSSGALMTVENDDEDGKVEDDVDGESVTEELVSSKEPFIPNKEWQEVKPGQSIPRGLHVQINMQTGKKEAKLMEDEPNLEQVRVTDGTEATRLQRMKKAIEDAVNSYETQEVGKEPLKYWTQDGKEGMANLKNDHFSRDDLKLALKKFKATKADEKDEVVPNAKKKFRSIEELKKDLSDIDLSVKTDPEIIQELLEQYKDGKLSNEDRVLLLTDLEFYVHQIDNANDFITLGGMPMVIQELNNTDNMISGTAAFVIGSAVQSNPKVQIQFLEAGALHKLLRMLATHTDDNLMSRILYALSALVRNFPYAQQKLMELGGVPTLMHVLDNGSTKVKLKIITLINDLVIERQQAEEQYKRQESDTIKQRLQQYNAVDLVQHVLDQGWCDVLPSLLSLPEHDSREKVVVAMWTILERCRSTFRAVVPTLRLLQEEYWRQAKEEEREADSDTYFRDLHQRIHDVISSLEHLHTDL